jgi:pyrimidine deaminase RibD-like protein
VETVEKRAMELAVAVARKSVAEDDQLHPKVGALLVQADQIVEHAFRGERGPGDHAEFTLFQKKMFGRHLSESTLFTTLEPCTDRKQHKTCVEWIVEGKIGRVFVGMLDPNPVIYSRGVAKLRQNGIAVEFFLPELREAIRADNRAFVEAFRANPDLVGAASFDFTHNDGNYTLEHGDLLFETTWSNASNSSIHVYKNGNLRGVGIARGASSFADVRDASVYDMTSRTQTPREGEIIVLENGTGKFAVVKIS